MTLRTDIYPNPKALIGAFAETRPGGRMSGRAVLAEVLTQLSGVVVTRNAVSNWYTAGIPPKFHAAIVRAARYRGIPYVTTRLLEAISAHPNDPPSARAANAIKRLAPEKPYVTDLRRA